METEEIPVIAYDEVQQLILSYFPDGIIEWRLWKLEDKDSDCNGVKPQSLMTEGGTLVRCLRHQTLWRSLRH